MHYVRPSVIGLFFLCIARVSYNWYILHTSHYIEKYRETTISTGGLLYTFAFDGAGKYMQQCHLIDKKCTFIPFQQWLADWQWIRSIQYIGKGLFVDYQAGVSELFNMTTNLSPYRNNLYVMSQYLVPLQKNSEKLTGVIVTDSWRDAIALGEKGASFLCDLTRVQEISQYTEQDFLRAYQQKSDMTSVCSDASLPHSLAFTYFYYLGNAEKAVLRYRVAALSRNATPIAAMMPAIILGRVGEHRQSAQLWYEKALATTLPDQQQHALYKAVFELTLHIIQTADQKQKKSICVQDLTCLQQHGDLQRVLQEYQNICKNIETQEESFKDINPIDCAIFSYARDEGFINLSGKFVYPLEPENYIYGRRPDVEQWWIVPVE